MPVHNPTQHPRGGNPANTGQFSTKENSESGTTGLVLPDPQRDDDITRATRFLDELAYPAGRPGERVEPKKLREVFRPGAVLGQAHRIYDYMEEHGIGEDSVTREAAFSYASAHTGVPYEDIYDAWVDQEPLRLACAACGAVVEARLLATVPGKCSDCVGVDVHNHRARTDGRMKMRNYGERRTNR